jgi:hypothetical protein
MTVRGTRKITERAAVELMRSGRSCLAQMHTNSGTKWFVVPDGEVTDKVAKALLEHPHIQPSDDGLFPGISQTFRFVTLPARLQDTAAVMLAETASSNPLLRFKKGEYFIGDNLIEIGHEFIAYPFDAMRGFVRWENDSVVEQRLGRIADRFNLELEDLPANEDWKPQYVLPLEDAESGEVVAFVSGSFGGKKAVNALINTTARAVKAGSGNERPLIRLHV